MPFKQLTVNTPLNEEAHILAQDDAAIFDAFWGGQSGIAPTGTRLAATKINDNLVRLGAGVVYCKGFAGRIRSGDTHDVPIVSGSAGQNRIDLIVAEFLRTGTTDTIKIKVVQGASSSGTPVQPTVTQQDIDASGTLFQLPLYRVRITGTSLGQPERVAPILATAKELIESLGSNAQGKGASQIGIRDVNSNFTAENVEAALDELSNRFLLNQAGAVNIPAAQFDNYTNNFPANSTYDFIRTGSDALPVLGSSRYRITGTVFVPGQYEVQQAMSFPSGNAGARVLVRGRNAGVWSTFASLL